MGDLPGDTPLTATGSEPNLTALLLGSSPPVQFALLVLLGFSVGSLGVILFKLRQLRLARRQSRRFFDVFWEAKNLATINAACLDMPHSPVAQVFRSGYQELLRVTRARKGANPGHGSEDAIERSAAENVERAMRRATNEQVTRLESALTFLATTASTAPFVGLFGTVWGVMNAFRGLSAARTSSVQAVAPGIAEALIATAVGLAAAIPAVVAFNHFGGRIRVLTTEMDNFAAEFLNIAERHFLPR